MAVAVIRVKRRLVEDPAESIVVSWKRRKLDDSIVGETTRLCLDLVKTVQTKICPLRVTKTCTMQDDAISFEMQNTVGVAHDDAAISTRTHRPKHGSDLRRTYKRLGVGLRDMNVGRMAKRALEKERRYKIVSSKRLALEEAEGGKDFAGGEKVDLADKHALSSSTSSASEKQICPSSSYDCAGVCTNAASGNSHPVVHDVELEVEDEIPVPSTSPVGQGDNAASNEGVYVYDLYYTFIQHIEERYFRLTENMISIEALPVFGLSETEKDSLAYSDDDNDENEDEETDQNTERHLVSEYPEDDSDAQEEPDENSEDFLASEENFCGEDEDFTYSDYDVRHCEDASSYVDDLADEFDSSLKPQRLWDYFDSDDSLDDPDDHPLELADSEQRGQKLRRNYKVRSYDFYMNRIQQEKRTHGWC